MSSEYENEVWHRALQFDDISHLGAGDRLLSAMLLFHGLANNGGVLHAIDVLEPQELTTALEGFEYFGFPRVVALVRETMVRVVETELAGGDPGTFEQQVDHPFCEWAADELLMKSLARSLRERPQDFAPSQRPDGSGDASSD